MGAWLAISCLVFPCRGLARIYIDINAPAIQRINIAIPDFKNLSIEKEHPELASAMPAVISHDLFLSGYFSPMEKEAFLDKDPFSTAGPVRFRDWSVIGAELLVKGGYTCIGQSVEVDVRLFEVFKGQQLMGKRFLGKIETQRSLMHRISNEIVRVLTGHNGMFLSRLAFVGTATGNKEIYVSDFDGHNARRITQDKSIALLPRWAPQGGRLLFNSYREGGPKLYMRELDSNRTRRVSGREGLNIGAAWAPEGDRVALTLSHGDNPDIYLIDLQGKILQRITDHWGIDVSPAFSPDGTKVAFVSNRSGSPQIYVRDLARGTEERVTFEGKYNTSPTWSFLNRIAYTSMVDGRFDIHTISPDGGNLRRLTEGQGNNEDPCWSPDGRYLAFSSNRDGRYRIYMMNANGLNQNRITSDKGDQTAPSWSPY
ncbi:MAG: Tol-Pal system beta propeller repeat protein TolB [Deltaproteobacteria bacterium]|nr:Tol-Pal system beta propeller repeat protein TolB [Deltaproteobacteria bacterium]